MQNDFPGFLDIEHPQNPTEDDEAAFNNKMRQERELRDFKEEGWYYWVRVASLLITTVIAFVCIGSYVCHLILPSQWHWLSSDQLDNMKDIVITILTGVIISQCTTYFLTKKR